MRAGFTLHRGLLHGLLLASLCGAAGCEQLSQWLFTKERTLYSCEVCLAVGGQPCASYADDCHGQGTLSFDESEARRRAQAKLCRNLEPDGPPTDGRPICLARPAQDFHFSCSSRKSRCSVMMDGSR